jgi:DNA-binding IclR family transcriptional regulator
MMGRKHQPKDLDLLYDAVDRYPGSRPGALARLLGWVRSQVWRALPAMEENGYLLSEDERGGLWPVRRKP